MKATRLLLAILAVVALAVSAGAQATQIAAQVDYFYAPALTAKPPTPSITILRGTPSAPEAL